MATIDYKCDTCNREIELIENKIGLTSFSGCIITQNCKGKLYFVKRNPNNLRENLPDYVLNLDDYSPRDLFFPYTQTIPSNKWIINHGFGPSLVIIVYDTNGQVVNPETYVTSYSYGTTTITFPTELSGTVHILSRTGAATVVNPRTIISSTQVSYNDILTFAIPKYITRIDSRTAPLEPPPSVPPVPPPSQPPLPQPAPFEVCSNVIRLEIEVTRPNEPTITCTETLDDFTNPLSPWFGWPQILVKNRKHYCIRTISLSKLKVFQNTNSQEVIIPDGTLLRITAIDYGTGILTNIPDRGLLILMANPPYQADDKITNKVFDCGEMVDASIDYLTFQSMNLYVNDEIVEMTYPDIKIYGKIRLPPPSPLPPLISPPVTHTPTRTPRVTPTSSAPPPSPTPTPMVTPTNTPTYNASPTPQVLSTHAFNGGIPIPVSVSGGGGQPAQVFHPGDIIEWVVDVRTTVLGGPLTIGTKFALSANIVNTNDFIGPDVTIPVGQKTGTLSFTIPPFTLNSNNSGTMCIELLPNARIVSSVSYNFTCRNIAP
jgi:hypothetical protein